MSAVWMVDERDYDDYTFHGVFSSEDLANAHAAQVGGFPEVTEIDVLTEVPHRVLVYHVARTRRHDQRDQWDQSVTPVENWSHEIKWVNVEVATGNNRVWVYSLSVAEAEAALHAAIKALP